jgi:hypothetical protein
VLATVVETRAFQSRAATCLTEAELHAAIDMIAADPGCGDLIVGGGGIRKVRFSAGGRGKSGGVRIIYYVCASRTPIFLLTVFAKNERSDLTKAELRELAKVARILESSYGA